MFVFFVIILNCTKKTFEKNHDLNMKEQERRKKGAQELKGDLKRVKFFTKTF